MSRIVQERRAKLEVVVRSLAQVDPLYKDGEPYRCITCFWADPDYQWGQDPSVHDERCAWRQAKEWVAQHPKEISG